jgi:ubiquinone/menaquinone biosynthesis C-methylase UbiE
MRALDVATGTGFTAVELSGIVGEVYAVDRTLGMLEQAMSLSENHGAGNMRFVMGDSTALPFHDAAFDIVTCRRAAHHFKDKDAFLNEVHRCLSNGGQFALVDMAAPEGFKNPYNSFERARDSSHEEAETFSHWKELIESHGFKIASADVEEERVSFEKWLYPVDVDTEEGRSCRHFLERAGSEFLAAIDYNAKDDTFVKRRVVIISARNKS